MADGGGGGGGDEYLIISMDTTGIKITNRGQWMDKKWKYKSKRLSQDSCCNKHKD